jgi:ATPase family associated with various cellular activities (AAA)
MPRTASQDTDAALDDCIATYGARSVANAAAITSANRDPIRRYLVASGVPSSIARAASLAQLRACWGDNAAIDALIPATPGTTQEPTNMDQIPFDMRRPASPAPRNARPELNAADLGMSPPSHVSPGASAIRTDTTPQSGQPAKGAAANFTQALADLLAAQEAKEAPLNADAVKAIFDREMTDLTDDLAASHATHVAEMDALRADLARAIAGAPRNITVSINGAAAGAMLPAQHVQFDTLLQMVASGCNVWLAGPAGSGKTTAARNVAKALGRPFYFTGAVDTEYKLLGYTDATGKTVRRPFREAWEHGGMFLFDEIDASLPGAVLALNAALAGDLCDFPDGCIPRHPDFLCIAAANTFGQGANAEYVGRMKQDAAFLDRFATLAWTVDEALERRTSGNEAWARHVQECRRSVAQKGLKVLVTPRATYQGAALLASGLTWQQAEASTIRKGMTPDQWNSVRPATAQQAAA